jgi:hypothetical protein
MGIYVFNLCVPVEARIERLCELELNDFSAWLPSAT